MRKHCRTTVVAVIAFVLGLAHAEARHEQEHARLESELTDAIDRLIDRHFVVHYLRSVRIENLRFSENGARVQPTLDRNGHQEVTTHHEGKVYFRPVPLWDHIYARSGTVETTTEAPGKRVTVALAFRDLEELEEIGEHDLRNKIFRLLAETYEVIFESDSLVCTAMVDFHAELVQTVSDDMKGWGHLEYSVMGPVFGTSMTVRQASRDHAFDEDRVWGNLTVEFVRYEFREELARQFHDTPGWLLKQPPDMDPPRKVHPCHVDD